MVVCMCLCVNVCIYVNPQSPPDVSRLSPECPDIFSCIRFCMRHLFFPVFVKFCRLSLHSSPPQVLPGGNNSKTLTIFSGWIHPSFFIRMNESPWSEKNGPDLRAQHADFLLERGWSRFLCFYIVHFMRVSKKWALYSVYLCSLRMERGRKEFKAVLIIFAVFFSFFPNLLFFFRDVC